MSVEGSARNGGHRADAAGTVACADWAWSGHKGIRAGMRPNDGRREPGGRPRRQADRTSAM